MFALQRMTLTYITHVYINYHQVLKFKILKMSFVFTLKFSEIVLDDILTI